MATRNLARAVASVTHASRQRQDKEASGRLCGGDSTSCSGWRVIRCGGFGEWARLGAENALSGLRMWQRHNRGTRILQLQQLWDGRSREPRCLMRGVNGAFWEGADSESPANIHFTSQNEIPEKEGSVLLSLIREIEPLDISLISKDATPDSTSAMKRTISGMLGLLPSDQFQVAINTPPDHLARLLVSSMMTGYTLRNAEYRLCLQRSLDLIGDDTCDPQNLMINEHKGGDADARQSYEQANQPSSDGVVGRSTFSDEFGTVSSTTASYIQELEAKLLAASKELEECKFALSSLELVRQEKNDLLDYLRSLKAEKVAELSQPSPEVHEAVEQIVAGIVGTMTTKMSPQVPAFGSSTLTSVWEENEAPEVIANGALQFQSTVTITLSRDHLARLLFWCTLIGYYMRGVEYRLELCRTLSLSGEMVLDAENDT